MALQKMSFMVILTTFLSLFHFSAAAQKLTRKEQTTFLATARARYYNLHGAGAQGFSCDITVDWDALFTKANGTPLPADDPGMQALDKSRLSANIDLSGEGSVDVSWTNSGFVHEDQKKRFARLQAGLQHTVEDFYHSLLPFFNDTAIPLHPNSVTKSTSGFVIDDGDKDRIDKVSLNTQYVITNFSTKSNSSLLDLTPTFSPSPKGLILTAIDGISHSPPTAPPSHTTISTTYQFVDGFQIPATIDVSSDNVPIVHLTPVRCTVRKHP